MKDKAELEAEAIDLLSKSAPHELEIYNRWQECIDFYVAGYHSAIKHIDSIEKYTIQKGGRSDVGI